MKKMKYLIGLLLGVFFVFSGCSMPISSETDSANGQESGISQTLESDGVLEEESIVSDTTDSVETDSTQENLVPLYAGQYVCYSVETVISPNGEAFVGDSVGNRVLQETDYTLDLKANYTFILRWTHGYNHYQVLYGTWSRNKKTITLTAVTGEEYTVQADGKYLDIDLGCAVKLSKKASAIHIAQDAVEGTYTFVSYSIEDGDEIVSATLGSTYTDYDGTEKVYTEATMLVDLQANGKVFFMGDRMFGLLGGYYGEWVQEENRISLTLDELEWVFEFTLQGNQLVLYVEGNEEEGIFTTEVVLEK